MDSIQWIKDNWADVLTVMTYAIAIASIIVKYTHNKIDDNIIMRLLKVVSMAPKNMK